MNDIQAELDTSFLSRLADEFGAPPVHAVALTGSLARSDGDRYSDVDFLLLDESVSTAGSPIEQLLVR